MAGFSSIIDGILEPFAPRMVHNRLRYRAANEEIRQFEAASPNRRTDGWRRSGKSANKENERGLRGLRNGARDLVRNDKTADAAVRQFAAHVVGDGITITMRHDVGYVQRKAQETWDKWAESPVDGRNDFYGVQKLDARAWFTDGEALNVWTSKETYCDRVRVFEGDYLDHTKNDGDRIIQGVELDAIGDRSRYWMFDRHPGDNGMTARSKPWAAEHIDHIFEEMRPGQVRGTSLLGSVMLDLKDRAEIKDAIMLKKKIQACLAVFVTPAEGNPNPTPWSETSAPTGYDGPPIETIRPGMIARGRAGDSVTGISPTADGDSVDFITKELAGIGAVTVPYHLLTGDVSQANYSSLRAAMLGFWALLDDWQNNVILPFVMKPAFQRRMKALYIETGDRRFLEVKPEYAMPVRRFIDPIKDVAGELAEVRAGFKLHAKSLAERGMTVGQFVEAKAAENKLFDDNAIVIETDVRKVTSSGILQAASGQKPEKSNKQED